MNAAHNPLSPDENILRRIHKNHCDPDQPLPILPMAFRPSKVDADGLSVFRENFISPAEVAAAGRKAGECYIVRLGVAVLHSLGLTVVSDDLAHGPPRPRSHSGAKSVSVSKAQSSSEECTG